MSASLRVLEKADYVSLARFLAEQTQGDYNEAFWLDRFDLFWAKNPSRTQEMPRGWALAEGPQILGFIGNIPAHYCVDGVDKTFFAATSWYVAEEARQRSLELLIPFLKQSTGLLDTTPTLTVSQILAKAGFGRLDRPWTSHELLLPVNLSLFSDLVASKLPQKQLGRWLVKPAARLALSAQSALKKKISPQDSDGYRYREISEFSPEYDDLWERMKRKHRVLGVRNAQQLNWAIFGSTMMQKMRRVVEVRRQDTLVGYAAVKRSPVTFQRDEGHFLELVDLFMDDATAPAFHATVSGLLALIESEGDRLAFLKMYALHPEFEAACKRAGFIRRRLESRYYVKGFAADGLFASPMDGDRGFYP